jgi:hypothetical protein
VETVAHRQLKAHAAELIRRHGGRAVATEVQCPGSRYVVDVAGYLDTPPRAARRSPRSRRPPCTMIVECKQSRSDFLRSCADADRLLRARSALDRIRRAMERDRLMREEPHLRRGHTSLFPELDDWDFTRSRLPAYREVLRRLRRLDRRLYGETKFLLMSRHRLADRLYLAAPAGLVRPAELPLGWGLMECDHDRLDGTTAPDAAALRVAVPAPSAPCEPRLRTRLLRNIAVAACDAAAAGARA